MADPKVQDFKNHAKFDPLFHFLMMPVALIAVLVAAYDISHVQNLGNAMLFIMSIAVLIGFLKIRTYALKVQDRVIRLEETLRMQRVLPEPLKARIGELSVSQFVALRFAPDAELTGLVEKTLANKWDSRTIKQNVVNWRPDHFRV
jgi:hypothetical protein